MKKTVGENLKMFRIKKGLSMEEAGKKIGVSAPAILKYERNKIIASLERLEEFAKIYDTTIDEILNIDASINIKYDNLMKSLSTSLDVVKANRQELNAQDEAETAEQGDAEGVSDEYAGDEIADQELEELSEFEDYTVDLDD